MDSIKKRDGFKDERHIILPTNLLEEGRTHALVDYTVVNELGYYPDAKYHYRERHKGEQENILIYCLEGAGTIEIIGKELFTLTRGSLYCIPKNIPHRYYSDASNPWSILWLHFETNLIEEFFIHDMKPIIIDTPHKNALLQTHFIDLFDIAEKDNSLSNIICTSQLLKLILTEIHYLKDGLSHDRQNTYLTKSIRFMNENISKDLTLFDLAKQLNISQSYVSTIFKKYLNKSPIDYFIEIRIEQACKYLKMTDLKIYEIAKKVGYHDPYYFSRIFKKSTNYSPKEYRNHIADSSKLVLKENQ